MVKKTKTITSQSTSVLSPSNTKVNHFPLIVKSSDSITAIEVNDDGFTTINKLVLLDQKDGTKWDFSIHGGEMVIEPHGKEEKRDFRINKIIGNDNK